MRHQCQICQHWTTVSKDSLVGENVFGRLYKLEKKDFLFVGAFVVHLSCWLMALHSLKGDVKA